MTKLERGERPRRTPTPTAILERDQLARFLAESGIHRSLFEFLAYTGLRINEALGLTWADIDHTQATIRVHRQLGRARTHSPLKTPASKREVDLAPAINKQLRERWLATGYKRPTDLVFPNSLGRGLDYRDVGEAFRKALTAAQISAPGQRLTLHSLRHHYASLLISSGLNVVYVSRQLGHASPNVTLGVDAHLYAQQEHAATAKKRSRNQLPNNHNRHHAIANTRSW